MYPLYPARWSRTTATGVYGTPQSWSRMNRNTSAALRPCSVSVQGASGFSKKMAMLFSGVTRAAPANHAWSHRRS